MANRWHTPLHREPLGISYNEFSATAEGVNATGRCGSVRSAANKRSLTFTAGRVRKTRRPFAVGVLQARGGHFRIARPVLFDADSTELFRKSHLTRALTRPSPPPGLWCSLPKPPKILGKRAKRQPDFAQQPVSLIAISANGAPGCFGERHRRPSSSRGPLRL